MSGFLNQIEKVNTITPKQFNAITHKLEFWINTKQLQKKYGKKGKCVIS